MCQPLMDPRYRFARSRVKPTRKINKPEIVGDGLAEMSGSGGNETGYCTTGFAISSDDIGQIIVSRELDHDPLRRPSYCPVSGIFSGADLMTDADIHVLLNG